MAQRLFDVVFAVALLVILSPLLVLAAVAIRLSSPGPAIHRATRVGRHGRTFTMFKLRTMRLHDPEGAYVITHKLDARVFALGRLLRRFRIDEMPQLFNVIRGEMAIVGPRPKDPKIVERHYTPLHRETLRARPGLTCLGAIYYIARGEDLLTAGDPETSYLRSVLPTTLALDIVYVREASLWYDLRILLRSVGALLRIGRSAANMPELSRAAAFVEPTVEAGPTPPSGRAML